MSVSAGVGGTSLVGVMVGGGAVTQSAHSVPAVVRSLPFTGASHIVVMVALALVLVIAGALAVGLARRASDGEAP
jgi:hypothetical protein